MKWTALIIILSVLVTHAALLSPRAKTAVPKLIVQAPIQWELAWNNTNQTAGIYTFTIHQSTNLLTFQTVGTTTNLFWPISMTNQQSFYRVSITWQPQ